jgi:hypothetical protein
MEQQLNRCVIHFTTTLTDIQACTVCSLEVAALSLRCVNDLNQNLICSLAGKLWQAYLRVNVADA